METNEKDKKEVSKNTRFCCPNGPKFWCIKYFWEGKYLLFSFIYFLYFFAL